MSTPDILLKVSVGRAINDWKEEVCLQMDAIERWINTLLATDRNGANNACEVCGSTTSLEQHHIAGRKHDPRTITVCRSCHRLLSDEQKTWDKRWEKRGQPDEVREAFLLQGLRDVLRLDTFGGIDSLYKSLADKFTEDISKKLRGK